MSTPAGEAIAAAGLERFAEERAGGAALAVHAAGRLETAMAGVANRRAGWPVTPGTVFQLGSVSKIYTALAVLHLAERGLVDLDTPVARWLPEWQGGLADERVASITPRHLLAHTSGLQSQHFESHGRGEGALAALAAVLAGEALVHPPGRLFSYNNTGYSVAGRLLQVVTGLTWDEGIRRFVSGPLSLRSTVTLPEEVLLHPAAVGARRDGAGGTVDAGTWYGSRALTPSGGVSTTAAELVTVALEATAAGGSRRLGLSSGCVAEMLAPQAAVLRTGTRAWGLGWTLFDTEDGSDLAGHNGDTPGQSAFLRVVPGRAIAVALLTNCQLASADVEPLLARVLDAAGGPRPVAGGVEPPAPGAAPGRGEVDAVTGTYGQQRYEVEVAADGAGPVAVTLETRQWGEATLQWFGRPEVRRHLRGRADGVGTVVAGDQRWWFLEAGADGRYAYATNGHLAFGRR